MRTEHIGELAEAYAVGALDHTERAYVEAHADACPSCKDLLIQAETTAHKLALAAAPVRPPVRCKRRLMERVERERFLASPTRRRWQRLTSVAWTTAAVFAVLWVVSSLWALDNQRRVAGLQTEVRQQEAELRLMRTSVAQFASLDQVMSNAKVVRMLEPHDSAADAVAHCYMRPGSKKAVLEVIGLPPLPSNQTYLVWVAREDLQQPLRAFNVAKPVERFEIEPPEPMDRYEWIMVTVEEHPQVTRPSGQMVLSGDL